MIVASMYLIYKNQLETCLDAIKRLKVRKNIDNQESMTYAGRLDPLASGLLIVLQGEEIIDKEKYLNLQKTYEFEVVFGVSTDTFDQLGIIYPYTASKDWNTLQFKKDMSGIGSLLTKETNIENLNTQLKVLEDEVEISYPFFSSKPIDGIPLFQYTKDHGIEKTNEKLPKQVGEIYNIECIGITSISNSDLVDESITLANSMEGEFRQHDVIESWKGLGSINHKILKLRVTCASGFYIRSLACWFGQIAGTGAIARNIVRTKVGEFDLKDAIYLD